VTGDDVVVGAGGVKVTGGALEVGIPAGDAAPIGEGAPEAAVDAPDFTGASGGRGLTRYVPFVLFDHSNVGTSNSQGLAFAIFKLWSV
jgi:hypothetical protein